MAAYPSSIRFLGLGKVADYPIDTRHRLWQLSDLSDSESDSEFRKFLGYCFSLSYKYDLSAIRMKSLIPSSLLFGPLARCNIYISGIQAAALLPSVSR
jgi:hypothetical protein